MRTEVVIFEAVLPVAGGVGVPVCDGLEPCGEGAGGSDVGGSGCAQGTENHDEQRGG